MDFGICLATAADSWKVVQRAEQLGFSHAWFFDTPVLNCDIFVGMAAAAMKTTKIKLGSGVLVPDGRIAPVAAGSLASLNALAPGRIELGISTGFTARRAMGLSAVKLEDMREYIRVIQAMLAGETVETMLEGKRRKVRFLNPEIGVINIGDPIPLHISAFGPKARKLTAELGAGWFFAMATWQHGLNALAEMRGAWSDAGRDPASLHAIGTTAGCVLSDGEPYDSPRAKSQAGPHANLVYHAFAEAAEFGDIHRPIPPNLAPMVEQYKKIYANYTPSDAKYLSNHRGHLMFLRPEEQALCTAELIKSATFTGTKPELRERIRSLREAGFKHFAVHIRQGHPQMLEDWAEVFEGL
jgi:5,10-methylenetetrahydromethanopterin reductase